MLTLGGFLSGSPCLSQCGGGKLWAVGSGRIPGLGHLL